ncbi:MAG: valine--tRNA ligase [Armatimonadota bacterium]|nr:valine--tRNA ligase [Armatimonadota bacterium]MDR7436589.1 valine--tRNA ligase [Armatimonadota bacterium]MDR7472992.1 valine--tRNA ligase [Armatimonadota bacterium]MDR7506600.1 valine--tRNA ligase [Armatimonadota bacterium]MDR7509164.1 valine--tRNA ligase [Armatimonadota bacterium]
MARTTIPTTYDPRQVEVARYRIWKEAGYFRAVPDPARRPWAVMMPLPNVTGELHIGHALNNSVQDVLTRFRRMQGYCALYQPGTDHAGIATQNVVERELAREGLRREDLGREKFEERVWAWVRKYGSIIYSQLERLGMSCDWDRKVFTLDPEYADAVLEAFVRLHRKGLIYRGRHMVNWCPRCETVISDLEVVHEEVDSSLWYVRYPGADGSPGVVVATQRPETILADVAVAVHPADDRYLHLVGTTVLVPLVRRPVPVIADPRVDPAFGTGALKITPGHDPLDREIGADHHLPTLVVLDPRGKMTPDTGRYAGLDRFAAREAVAADLQAAGLLERVEPYRTSVGHCDRCHTVIEPYISDQWFLEVADLARRAADAIRAGQVRFHPERWAKVALDWLDGIRPWVISRQLWWGHRIPVWQCAACGERTVSKAAPPSCPRCGAADLAQDPDVLDTWFSSALWPLATLGWPRDTEDLRYFYPTSVLVTDRGIIFLWVCRMIMFGLEFMNQVPFADVYIHPTVLTLTGQRMSKSLGTGIDPLEMADARGYGADAVRYALVSRCSQAQQDMRFGEKMIADVRTFTTKLWNAARFVLLNLDGFDHRAPVPGPEVLSAADRWIRSRHTRLTAEVTALLEGFEFDKAARALYDFLWGEFCDWYVEMAKGDLQREARHPARRHAIQHTLWWVLSRTVQLLHPIMPFITEEVWQALPHDGPSIMISPWPQADPAAVDPQAEAEVPVVMETIRAIRSLRADLSVPPGRRVPVHLRAEGDARAALEAARPYLMDLARVDPVHLDDPSSPRPAGCAAAVLPAVEILLPLRGLVDVRREQARLARALEEVTAEIQRLDARLQDREFVERAPADVVSRQRERTEELRARARRIRELLAALAAEG